MRFYYLHTLLQLDSLYRFLTWGERMIIHAQMLEKTKRTTENIERFLFFVESEKWQAPEMRYGQDRLLYYLKEEGFQKWEQAEEYRKQNPELTRKILNIWQCSK